MERIAAPASQSQPLQARLQNDLIKVAQDLEATFLAEMLDAAGLHKTPDFAGGGQGEDQFQSMLVSRQADALAQTGGIGLAEHIFEALKEGRK